MAAPQALTPQQIGSSFVSKYYHTLTRESDQLYKFYKDNSSVIYGNENEAATVVSGLESISNKIKSLDYKDSKVKLSVVDSLSALNGGILVVVQGYLSIGGQQYKKFTQSFVLAEQVQPKGYYVLNDVFRFISAEQAPPASKKSQQQAPTQTQQQVQPQQPPQPQQPQQQHHHHHTVIATPTAIIHHSLHDNISDGGSSEVDSTAATAGTSSVIGVDDSTIVDSENEGKAKGISKSTTSTTSASSNGSSDKKEKETPEVKETLPVQQTQTQVPPQQPPQQPQQAPSQPKPAQTTSVQEKKKYEGPKTYAAVVGGDDYVPPTPTSPTSKEEKKEFKGKKYPNKNKTPHAVFVAKLNPETTSKDLTDAFQQFGKPVHISNKAKENGFAFVHFETAEAMEKAIAQSGKLVVKDAHVTVDVKKISKGRGERPPRGKYGFRGEKGDYRGGKFSRGRGRGRGNSKPHPQTTSHE